MKTTIRKALIISLRVLFSPLAALLIVLGWLLMRVWPTAGILLIVGLWMLGGDMPVVG